MELIELKINYSLSKFYVENINLSIFAKLRNVIINL